MTELEKMDDFFARRAEGYDEHMLNEVAGCREAYAKMSELVPEKTENLLDLGCGTGLELESIFKRFPDISVTGIDLTKAMLDRLPEKFSGKSLTLINGDYFSVDLEKNRFDTAVSFETMHHFTIEKKTALYRRIWDSLKDGGVYIECDYMVETPEEEDRFSAENIRIRKELNISPEELYHFDTPCTVENQIKSFGAAGFSEVREEFKMGNTVIITAKK